MEPFNSIARALCPDSEGTLSPRLRAALRVYLASANLSHRGDDVDDFYGALTVKALEHADQFHAGRPLEGWLMLMAHNLVREAKRRAKKGEIPMSQLAPRGDDADEAEHQIAFFERMRGASTQKQIETHRQRAPLPMPDLAELLPHLSPNAQELLRWSIEEGWDTAQIVAHTGKTRAAIDTGLCRARAALYKAYHAWKRDLEAREDGPQCEWASSTTVLQQEARSS